mmetsp:Transcript_22347/g.33784  ORF Transcript_22347/g.33784 Transcript_22347/m.33784 type:complete len:186 (-) Transcript_22347:168-725(-)
MPMVLNHVVPDLSEDTGVPSRRRGSNRHPDTPDKRNEADEKKDKVSDFKRRVLLVDDTLINRKVLERMLKKIGVSTVVTVDSGKKALEELSSNEYDLVITDLQMPGMSGTELCVAIHKSTNAPPIVVGLTADTSFDIAERCAAAGMADVLYKPITISEMKEYFEITVPRLKQGAWYADTYGVQKE